MSAVSQPATGQPDGQDGHCSAPDRATVLDMLADGAERAPQPALHSGLGQSDLGGDLPVGVTAEVRQLDDLCVFTRQRADGFVDRVTDHGARKILPGMRPVIAIVHALEKHLLEAPVGAAHAAAIDGSSADAGHQPRSPCVVRGTGKQVVLSCRHIPVLRCTTNSGCLESTRGWDQSGEGLRGRLTSRIRGSAAATDSSRSKTSTAASSSTPSARRT